MALVLSVGVFLFFFEIPNSQGALSGRHLYLCKQDLPRSCGLCAFQSQARAVLLFEASC